MQYVNEKNSDSLDLHLIKIIVKENFKDDAVFINGNCHGELER